MPVRAGIVDDNNITRFDFRQLAVNCEFIIILTQRPGDIIDMLTGGILFAFSAKRYSGLPGAVGGFSGRGKAFAQSISQILLTAPNS